MLKGVYYKMTVLYLGLEVPDGFKNRAIIHYPIIKIVPRSYENPEIQAAFKKLHQYTHLLFTSKSTVRLFCEMIPLFGCNVDALQSICTIAVGSSTASVLRQSGIPVAHTAQEEHAEGLVQILNDMPLNDAYFFWPHSALSRTVLTEFFERKNVRYHSCILYDTVPQHAEPIPDLNRIDEIFFTSPSTVDAFLQIFGPLPLNKKLTAIGPVTHSYLERIRPI